MNKLGNFIDGLEFLNEADFPQKPARFGYTTGLNAALDAQIEACLRYPYSDELPAGSYVLRPTTGEFVARMITRADLEGLTPVLAIGSNRVPRVNANKMTRKEGRPGYVPGLAETNTVIPTTKVVLKNGAVVYGATAYRSIPATLARVEGAEVELYITWLSKMQMKAMHATEDLEDLYERRHDGTIKETPQHPPDEAAGIAWRWPESDANGEPIIPPLDSYILSRISIDQFSFPRGEYTPEAVNYIRSGYGAIEAYVASAGYLRDKDGRPIAYDDIPLSGADISRASQREICAKYARIGGYAAMEEFLAMLQLDPETAMKTKRFMNEHGSTPIKLRV
jgi:hypothetical protein